VYTLREFRAKTKEAFDSAENKVVVLVNRNGVVFELSMAGSIKDFSSEDTPRPQGSLCKHGYSPQFCKYAKGEKPCK